MERAISIHTSRKRLMYAMVYAAFISLVLIVLGLNNYISAVQYALVIFSIVVSVFFFSVEIEVPKGIRPRLIFNICVVFILSIIVTISLDLINEMYTNVSESGLVNTALRFILSVIFCFSIYVLTIALIGRVRKAGIICTSLLAGLGVISYVVWALRGSRLVFSDLAATFTALEVLGGYRGINFTTPFYLGILTFICTIPIVWHLKPDKYYWKSKTRLGIYFSALFLAFGIYLSNFEVLNYSWSEVENSYLYSFIANAKLLTIHPPRGYSAEKAEEIIMDADAEARIIDSNYDAKVNINKAFPGYLEARGNDYPNIIVVMNESYADLQVFGDIPLEEEVFPVTSNLMNSLQGDVFTEVYGGGTADSEYTFLTGNSTLLLPNNARPYQLYIDDNTPNMVSQLKKLGYEAVAIHPGSPTAWSRNTVYGKLGFDAFYDNSYFKDEDYKRIPTLISDEATYDEIISIYEQKGDVPFFAFDVTIQNHGSYGLDYSYLEQIQADESVPDEIVEYLSLIRASDMEFAKLIHYFQTQKEPTIILMFGDHQPNLQSNYIEELVGKDKEDFNLRESQRLQATPYVIWANYKLPTTQVGSVSLNFLSTLLMECAGLPISDYNQYLESLHEDFLIVDRKGIIDKYGNYYSFEDESSSGTYKEKIEEIKQVLYYAMIDTQNRDETLFEGRSP